MLKCIENLYKFYPIQKQTVNMFILSRKITFRKLVTYMLHWDLGCTNRKKNIQIYLTHALENAVKSEIEHLRDGGGRGGAIFYPLL